MFRNLGSWFTNRMTDWALDKPPGFYLSSFRCLSAFVREQIASGYDGPYPYVDGLLFQVTQNVGRLQVDHLARAEGRSNYTLRRLVRLWLSMFLNFSVMPLRLATLLGLGFGALGVHQNGLIKGKLSSGEMLPWADVESTTLKQGKLRIKRRGKLQTTLALRQLLRMAREFDGVAHRQAVGGEHDLAGRIDEVDAAVEAAAIAVHALAQRADREADAGHADIGAVVVQDAIVDEDGHRVAVGEVRIDVDLVRRLQLADAEVPDIAPVALVDIFEAALRVVVAARAVRDEERRDAARVSSLH